jgi:methionine sulfoxide reductase heme-binding subunit
VIYSMVFAGLMIARWKLHVNQAKR